MATLIRTIPTGFLVQAYSHLSVVPPYIYFLDPVSGVIRQLTMAGVIVQNIIIPFGTYDIFSETGFWTNGYRLYVMRSFINRLYIFDMLGNLLFYKDGLGIAANATTIFSDGMYFYITVIGVNVLYKYDQWFNLIRTYTQAPTINTKLGISTDGKYFISFDGLTSHFTLWDTDFNLIEKSSVAVYPGAINSISFIGNFLYCGVNAQSYIYIYRL
jgi:hypothetical protein